MKRIFSFLLAVVLTLGLVTVGTVEADAKSELSISDECVQMIKDLEGFDKYPRWDYSQWTVGHGTRCPDEDLERYRKNGITYEEADALLRQYAESFGKSVNSFIDKYDLKCNQAQFDALLMFTYNFGTAWMVKNGSFKNGLIKGLTGNDFLYEIGQWCHVSGGTILKNLIRRRLMEANMYLNGVYSRTVRDNYCYVIYEFEGGDGETDVQCYDSDHPVKPYVIPVREGYTFAGWYTEKTGGTKVTKLNASVRNMKLYARWVEGSDVPVEEEPAPDYTVDESTRIDPVKITVTANGVNIRKGPGTNYTVCGSVSKGKTMTITEIKVATGYTWGKFDGGWIALCFTNYESVKDLGKEETPEKPTEPPVTEPPATEPPATEPPATEPPATEPPATEPPATEPVKPEEPKGQIGTVTGNNVNVRKGPGTNYQVVSQRDKGDKVTVTETKKSGSLTWGKIEDGWIAMKYVKLSAAEKEEAKGQMGTVTGKMINVRSGPGTNYKIVGYAYKGNRVTIYETKKVGSSTWGRMDAGWIAMSYVKLDQSVTETPTVPTEPTEPPKETAPTEPPKETTPAETWTGTVKINGKLRIRQGPGTNYKVVGYLTNGTKLTILEIKDTWARIDKGWTSLDYVVLDSNNGSQENDKQEETTTWTGTVIADCLHIRAGAGTGYKIVGRLYEGAKVTILETNGNWGRINKGWISLNYVKK
jgi:uncharacterized repeat protein (TIGR02543 family)